MLKLTPRLKSLLFVAAALIVAICAFTSTGAAAHAAEPSTASRAAHSASAIPAAPAYRIYASSVDAGRALAVANTIVLMRGDQRCPAPSATQDGAIVNHSGHECFGILHQGKPGTYGYSRYVVFTVAAHSAW